MKKQIQKALEFQVKRYFKKHKNVKIIVVTGSVGKTSTKNAIATVLKQKYRVRVHSGNHNVHLSVPLTLLDIPYPENIRSPWQWFKVLILMQGRIRKDTTIDVIIQELGTDQPGDIPHFGTYLRPDIAVVTAVSPEHMEFFKTEEAVAQEELVIAKFSKLTLINRDDISEDYAKFAETTSIDTYGISGVAEYRYLVEDSPVGLGFKGKFVSPEFGEVPAKLKLVGEHNIRAAVAAGCIGAKLGLSSDQIKLGLEQVVPSPGRMQLLRGVSKSILIDDTYNSSPLAASAALKTLYTFPAPQRIAILGSMNELGETSAAAHEQLGSLCDSTLLAYVVTIGDDAERYLAPAAGRRGCQVKSFKNPYDAGAFVHKVLEPGAIVLVKGSQNGVYAEEALKILLHSTSDEEKLVRQSTEWLEKKQKQFFA